MSVQTFNPSDIPQGTANWAVAQRVVGAFAPHAQVTPNMTVAIDPGFLLTGTTLTEVNAQLSRSPTPPSMTNGRCGTSRRLPTARSSASPT